MSDSIKNSGQKVKGYIYITISYILALLISLIVGTLLAFLPPLLTIFLADISATFLIFFVSCIFKNASFYDPYWSVAPGVIVIYWFLNSQINNVNFLFQIFILLFVLIWSIRLTYNWARQWQGLRHEDWRYSELRIKHSKYFWAVNLVGIQLMPTILVFLGCLSFYPIFSIKINSFIYIGLFPLFIILLAIIIETIADRQLFKFIKTRKDSTEIIKKGLWKYSRHPNYFGEILFWWGLYLFAVAIDLLFWWMFIGPFSITILFYILSIPLMEKRNLSRKPDYLKYKERVSKLIPWFPKKNNS